MPAVHCVRHIVEGDLAHLINPCQAGSILSCWRLTAERESLSARQAKAQLDIMLQGLAASKMGRRLSQNRGYEIAFALYAKTRRGASAIPCWYLDRKSCRR